MIVIIQSLDTSWAVEKAQGSFEETKSRYEIFTEFDDVVLLTQDDQDFSQALSSIVHVPCASSKSNFIRRVLSRSPYIRWFYFFMRSFAWLIKHYKQIDLLITENIDSPAPLLISIFFKIPYIIYYRYDVGHQVKWVNRQSIIGTIVLAEERFALKRVQKLWVTSPHLANLAKALGRRKHVAVIPNWIGKPEIFPRIAHLSKEKPIQPSILFVGRLHKVKQVDLLLQSLRILHNIDSNTHLYILGDGEEYYRLKTLAENIGLSNYAHFLGFVNKLTVLKMMRQSDVLVLPSKVEGNPRVLIEAMMCKIPIVATNVLGIKDIVQHKKTGYLVDNPDPRELARAIRDVIKNKKLSSAMADRAYDFAKQNFSKERAIQKIREELSSILTMHACERFQCGCT